MEFSATAAAAAAAAATQSSDVNRTSTSNNALSHHHHVHPNSMEDLNHNTFLSQHHNRRSSSNSFGSFSLNGEGSDSLNSLGGGEGNPNGGGLDSMNSSWNDDVAPTLEDPRQQQHININNSGDIGADGSVYIYGRVVDDSVDNVPQAPHYFMNAAQPSYNQQDPHEQQQHLQQIQEQQQHQQIHQPLHSPSFGPSGIPSMPLSSSSSGYINSYEDNIQTDPEVSRIQSTLQAVASIGHQQQQQQQHAQPQHHQTPASIGYRQQPSIPTDPQQHHLSQSQQQTMPHSSEDVIELLDDVNNENTTSAVASTATAVTGIKRPHDSISQNATHNQRKPTPILPGSTIVGFENQYRPQTQSYAAHQLQHPHLQQQQQQQQLDSYPHQYTPHAAHPPPYGQAAAIEQLRRANMRESHPSHHQQNQNQHRQLVARTPQQRHRENKAHKPKYIDFPPNHAPTWTRLIPEAPVAHTNPNEKKAFELSLLNVKEFTITGQPVGAFDTRRSSVLGYRKVIKELSRAHGKAKFERDKEFRDESGTDGGKWRIPLGAYPALFGYLRRQTNCNVQGIPEEQLRVASLGKARLEKGFPSVKKIMAMGVPEGLARALAPFQRGGVEFVKERSGRALIADDMGLGKTIQGIASMSMYHDEWPLLVLTPSSARYHWEAEFQQWLGKPSKKIGMAQKEQHEEEADLKEHNEEVVPADEQKQPMLPLRDYEIHVLTSGKERVLPHKETKVVICSYGLAPSLAESGKIRPGMFQCAIVDESHMLKNIKTKRTSFLVPVLHATSRCVLLSGTPALARPSELWPQLKILSTEKDGMWENEADFYSKYVQRTSAVRRAELHTMLTGTLMIRRMKHDILKSLPSKQRAKALVDVATNDMRREFHKCMGLLREGKGVMAKLAQKRSALKLPDVKIDAETLESLKQEYDNKLNYKMQSLYLQLQSSQFNDAEKENVAAQMQAQVRQELDVWYKERLHEIQNDSQDLEGEEIDRKTVLNRMYSLTAKAKVPLIASNIKKWLNDPTKGKLCVFAHHIFVLDELEKLAGLSNAKDSEARFIRIDGSTSPKDRQAQIKAFQSNPDIRIAVLGITAAGVAVTLTAASTVWFAELFWTPALMIQAEDRCHRIGQNAVVNCLYYVAEGTLDVLLWDLLEKKFRDLGEFVEGKEKMKIVVHKTYESIKDLMSLFSSFDGDDFDAVPEAEDDEDCREDEDRLIKLEDDLHQDITQLAQEEMVMITQGTEGDDEEGGEGGVPFQSDDAKEGPGQSEEDAICIIDDDDDEPQTKRSTEQEDTAVVEEQRKSPPVATKDPSLNHSSREFDISKPLRDCRLYSQTFEGESFGISLYSFEERVVIGNNTNGRAKPAAGDILVSVNGLVLEYGWNLNDILAYMKKCFEKGQVELQLVESEAFAEHFLLRQHKFAAPVLPPIVEDGNGVIEILDDD